MSFATPQVFVPGVEERVLLSLRSSGISSLDSIPYIPYQLTYISPNPHQTHNTESSPGGTERENDLLQFGVGHILLQTL
jgi:hypothetical protein